MSESQHDASVQEDESRQRGGALGVILDWAPYIVVPIIVGLLLHAFVVEAFIVPTGSMLETIQLNDCVWSEKVSYRFRSPEQGEIVLLQSPTDETVTLLKRVIATEGQTIDFVDGVVYVDGVALDEPYTGGKPTYPSDTTYTGAGQITYPYVVPEGHVWLMGDNRTNSRDSRYYGAIPVSSVYARAFFTYWPLPHAHFL